MTNKRFINLVRLLLSTIIMAVLLVGCNPRMQRVTEGISEDARRAAEESASDVQRAAEEMARDAQRAVEEVGGDTQRAAEEALGDAQRNLERAWDESEGTSGGLLCPDMGAVLILPMVVGICRFSGVVGKNRRKQ